MHETVYALLHRPLSTCRLPLSRVWDAEDVQDFCLPLDAVLIDSSSACPYPVYGMLRMYRISVFRWTLF